jgi:hypothetical protein
MRFAYPLCCLAVLASFATPSLSSDNKIEILEISGKVLVTTAEGVFPAEAGQSLAEGSSVFVGDDATARLAATDLNCQITLPTGKVTVINTQKLCDVKITPTATDGGYPGGVSPPVVGLLFFGAVMTSAIVAVALDEDDDDPISVP